MMQFFLTIALVVVMRSHFSFLVLEVAGCLSCGIGSKQLPFHTEACPGVAWNWPLGWESCPRRPVACLLSLVGITADHLFQVL